MTIEDEHGVGQEVEVDATEVEAQAAPDVAADDDVEAHVWRAQS